MDNVYSWYGNTTVLHTLHRLPRRIMSLQESKNIAEFVLHELCQKQCFDIPRAVYLIDNPDYDCMKGIAGYCQKEQFKEDDIWSCPLDFTAYMREASFNNTVRKLQRHSCHRHNESLEDVARDVAHNLGLQNVGSCVVPMPHDNHGIFLYEKVVSDEQDRECLLNAASLLSFCPIY